MAPPGMLKASTSSRYRTANKSRTRVAGSKIAWSGDGRRALLGGPVQQAASDVSMFGVTKSKRRPVPTITRPKAATPVLPYRMRGPLVRNGIQNNAEQFKRFTAAPDWFVPDSYSTNEESEDPPSADKSTSSECLDNNRATTMAVRDNSLTVSQARPVAGGGSGRGSGAKAGEEEYDPANHTEDALNYRNLNEFITVVNDKYRDVKSRTVLEDSDRLRRVTLRDGELLVDIRRDVKDVFRSKVLVSGDGGRNVNVETRMDPKFEKVLVTSITKDPETERRNREKERCLWLQEDRMRWIRALYEHIKEFRTQAKFYLALVIEARGRDPEYDPEDDDQVVAIRKQMIPWADEVMSNVLLLAGIETQIYADLQKDMPSVKL